MYLTCLIVSENRINLFASSKKQSSLTIMYTTLRLKKNLEALIPAIGTNKQAGIAILISDKRDQTKAS